MPNNILINPSLWCLASFWIVLVTFFNYNPEYSIDLTIFVFDSILSFDIISVLILWPDPKILLCIPASAADAAAVNPNGTKTF